MEYITYLCPFWNGNKLENFQCEVTEGNCLFSFARDQFLNCPEYLSEVLKKRKKNKPGR